MWSNDDDDDDNDDNYDDDDDDDNDENDDNETLTSPLPAELFPRVKSACTHSTWVDLESGTVRVKCLAQEHEAITPASAQIRTAWFRVQPSNYLLADGPFLKPHSH